MFIYAYGIVIGFTINNLLKLNHLEALTAKEIKKEPLWHAETVKKER